MAAGTMVKLAASDGDIDTSDSLSIFGAYQKCFVVNGANLKVADFINTKLTHAALSTPHANGDTLTQATSNATMTVDFTNTAKTETYGYVTSGTFDDTNSVSGSGDGDSFTPTAVTSSPHWYDWTVYPGGSSGSMPSKAYLGCLYSGRCVLSGNPAEPHQWYMSRQGNPWDFAYTANDAQSPVAGGNANAGEIGDIVRALIPYKDDYLIFGCASSMHMLRGDPAAGGSRDALDLTVGIFGSHSWCFDNEGNLYFWGTDGLYILPAGSVGRSGGLQSLSNIRIPDLVDQEGADPTTHRITMGYDQNRHGILTCVTVLATGVNSNYWYDLHTNGFYPETYPEECGPYSLFYYDANDIDYRGLLVGCRDGYIRVMDDSSKDDDIGPSDEAISSYAVLPLQPLADGIDREGIINQLVFTTAGGASGGSLSDTDGMSYDVYTADDAETLIENIEDGDTAGNSGTITGPKRTSRIRTRSRGMWGTIKLSNSTANQTWAINRVLYNKKEGGRI